MKAISKGFASKVPVNLSITVATNNSSPIVINIAGDLFPAFFIAEFFYMAKASPAGSSSKIYLEM